MDTFQTVPKNLKSFLTMIWYLENVTFMYYVEIAAKKSNYYF